MGLAVCIRCRTGGSDLSGEILSVVAVTHLYQSGQISTHRRVVQIKRLSVRPVNIIETVNICLIDLLVGSSRHAFQTVIITAVHQHLSACDLDHISVGSGLTVLVVGIDDRSLLDFHIHDLG